jgi:hypothetical protein
MIGSQRRRNPPLGKAGALAGWGIASALRFSQ